MIMNPYARGKSSGAFEQMKKVEADYGGVSTQLAEKAQQTHLTEKTGYGVISGLGVTAHGTPDMAVAITAGVAYMSDGTRYAPFAVASQAVTAADATNPRIDILYLSGTGGITYLAGAAAASPVAPTLPTGALLLAEISVAAGATGITTSMISDKRKGLWISDWFQPTLLNGWSAGARVPEMSKDFMGIVRFRGLITGGAMANAAFGIPVGYRAKQPVQFNTNANLAYANGFYNSTAYVFVPQTGTNVNFSLDGISWLAEN